MKTGDVVEKNLIAMAKTGGGFSEPFVFEAGTVLPSYGLSNGGVVVWEEFNFRAGAIENAMADGSVRPAITASGLTSCPKNGDWEILGTEVKISLKLGDTFLAQYKDYIWTLREKPLSGEDTVRGRKQEMVNEYGTSN